MTTLVPPPTRPNTRSRAGAWIDLGLSLLALIFIAWLFQWTNRSIGGFQAPGPEDYYNFQVQGWLKGHLHLSVEPSEAMRALKDPYDPAQNGPVRLADASYYEGHYYLYFGSAPAFVLLFPYALLTGKALGSTIAVYLFGCVGVGAAGILWLSLRRRYYPDSAIGIGALGILFLGCGTHLLTLQRRPFFWELSIVSAFAFSMLAFLCLYWALHGRRPVLAMLLGGLFFGLTIASRPTYLVGAVAILPVLWHLRREPATAVSWKRAAVAAFGAIGVCVLAMLVHNVARFDHPLEFGLNYQLTSSYESKMKHFSWSYLPQNLRIYFLHPADWSAHFPFVKMTGLRGGPPGYLSEWNESICGLFVSLPMTLLLLACPFLPPKNATGPGLRVLVTSLGIYFLIMGTLISALLVATSRYMIDFTPALALLAAIGWLNVERWASGLRAGFAIKFALILLCLVTVVAGIAISFNYHDDWWKNAIPLEWAKTERFFAKFGLGAAR